MTDVIGCIDGTACTASVCDHAIWAAGRLAAPLRFLHALDRHPEHAPAADFSGSIGLGAQESLLQELADLDEKHSMLAQRQGRQLLDIAVGRARAAGLAEADGLQRHGGLVESLLDLEPRTRLVVLGQHAHAGRTGRLHLDNHVERVVRSVQRAVLVTGETFETPKRFAIAFDGSATGRRTVERVAQSPLLKGLGCEVAMAGSDARAVDEQLRWAGDRLAAAGFDVRTTAMQGDVEKALPALLESTSADLLVMGAYGHSRIRQLIVGSTTTLLLRTSPVPVLVLR